MNAQQSTAVINVEPKQDEVVVKLGSEAIRVWEYARKLEVKTTEDVRHATEDLSLISTIRKKLEEKRKEFVQPLDEHRKAIQEKFKTITGPVDMADRMLRDKILAYNQEQYRLQEEAERARQLIEEAKAIQQGLTQQTGEVFEPLQGVPIIDGHAAVQRAYTGTGSMTTRKNRKWEVVNIYEVPGEYLMVDVVKVGKVVRAGIPSIPGIHIWEEESLAITPVRPPTETEPFQNGRAEQREEDHPLLEIDASTEQRGDIPF